MEDMEIVALFWGRSQQALVETAGKYGAYCRTIANNILHDPQDAEECENDAYTAAWNAIPPAKPLRLAAFLGRLTRNIALDRLDYHRAQKRNGEQQAMLDELEECIPASGGVEETWQGEETVRLIDAFLAREGRESRVAFVRRYWYADPVGEIAGAMGLSQSKVKSMLFRTRKRLKAYLEQEGVTV